MERACKKTNIAAIKRVIELQVFAYLANPA
jgi:hypothetical protein